jgi:hypothetical protein
LATTVSSWFTASIAFLPESEIVVVALGAIPIAAVISTIIALKSSASIVSVKSTSTFIPVETSTSVVAAAVVSLTEVSFFFDFLWSNVNFDSNKAGDVEFPVEVGDVCEGCFCVSKHAINLADVITSCLVDDD